MSQTRASGQSEVNFARALSEVISLAECLSLPGPVMSRAGGICKKAFADLSITRAFSLKVLAASSVYVASCQVAMGVTINEVAESGEVLRSEAIKCSRKLQRRLRVILPTPTPQEYTPRILAAMKVSPQDPLAVETLKMIGEADSRAIQGKNPAGVACAAVYTISKKLGRGITMRALSRVGYVTEATIRNACSSLSP